jgi:hypothetical protein
MGKALLTFAEIKRLRAALEETIRCGEGARRVGEGYRQAGGAVADVDALEELVG